MATRYSRTAVNVMVSAMFGAMGLEVFGNDQRISGQIYMTMFDTSSHSERVVW